MRRRPGFVLTAFVAIALAAGVAGADGALRCGARIVRPGDSTYRVQSICGDPIDVIERTEYRTVRVAAGVCPDGASGRRCRAEASTTREVRIAEWTYDFGANRLLQRLRFEDGVLADIDATPR